MSPLHVFFVVLSAISWNVAQGQNVGFASLNTCNYVYAMPLTFSTGNKTYPVNVLLDTGSALFALNTKDCKGCAPSEIPTPTSGQVVSISYDSNTGFEGIVSNGTAQLPGTSLNYVTPWVGRTTSTRNSAFCNLTLDGIAGYTAGTSNASLIESYIQSKNPTGIPASFAIQTCGNITTLGQPKANLYYGGYPSKIVDQVNWYPMNTKGNPQVWTFPGKSMLIGGTDIGVDLTPYNLVFDSGWGENINALAAVGGPMLQAFQKSGGIVFNSTVPSNTIESFWNGQVVTLSPSEYQVYPDKLTMTLVPGNGSTAPVLIPGYNLVSISGNQVKFIPGITKNPAFTAVHFGQVAFLGKLIVHDDSSQHRIGFGNLTTGCDNLGVSDIDTIVGSYNSVTTTDSLTIPTQSVPTTTKTNVAIQHSSRLVFILIFIISCLV